MNLFESKHDPRTADVSDELLIQALKECQADVDAGRPIDRESILARFSTIREELIACLEGMALIEQAAQSVANERLTSPMTDCHEHAAHPAVLGDFRLIGEIGRGGMGIVYEAVQVSLSRKVAVKILPWTGMLSANQLQRFKNEAQSAASLHHPHIVNAFFVGQERGVHFYAMRHVEGVSLAQVIEGLKGADHREPDASECSHDAHVDLDTRPFARLSTARTSNRREFCRSVASFGIQAAGALHYAHSMGIVHRDIKPSNLLIDQDAHLWVTDFGLASTQTSATITMSGDVLGTLRYMSPEQAAGEHGFTDHRTDVYSLGVTLYELLTGCPAVPGEDRLQLLRNMDRDLIPPIALDPRIPQDLNKIILKATSRRPADRYGSADELRDDLERFLDHRPVKARRMSRIARVSRWAQARPLLATLVVAVSTLATILAFGGPWAAILLDRKVVLLDEKIRDLDRLNYSSSVALAYHAWGQGRLSEVEQQLEFADRSGGNALRGFEWDHLAGRLSRALDVPRGNLNDRVTKIVYSPDGKRVVSACADGSIRFWDAHDLTQLMVVDDAHDKVLWIEYCPDNEFMISSGMDGRVKIWSAEKMDLIAAFDDHENGVMQASVSPDGSFLVTLEIRSRPVLWRLHREGTTWQRAKLDEADQYEWGGGVCFSPDSSHLVSWNAFSGARVWRIRTCDVTKEVTLDQVLGLPLVSADVYSCAYSEDGTRLVTAGKSVEIWDTTTWKRQVLLSARSDCYAAAFFERGSRLVTIGMDPLRVWDPARPNRVRQVPAKLRGAKSLAVSPDGQCLVAPSSDHSIRKVSLVENRLPQSKVLRSLRSLTFCEATPDAAPRNALHHVAVSMSPMNPADSLPPSLDLIDLDSGSRVVLEADVRRYWRLATNPRLPHLVAVGGLMFDGQAAVDVWDVRTRKKTWSPPTEISGAAGALAFSNSGRLLAIAGTHPVDREDPSLEIWDVKRRERLHRNSDLGGFALAFSPGDQALVVGDVHGRCHVLEVDTWRPQESFAAYTQMVTSGRFSDTGQLLTVATLDGAFSVFAWPAVDSLIDERRLRADSASIAVSPDDRTVVVAVENQIEFWRTDIGQMVGVIDTLEKPRSVRFSPDGQQVAWVGDNGTVHVWHRGGRQQIIPPIEQIDHGADTQR